MIYDRCWTVIIFVINVAIILIDRRHSGVLPVLFKPSDLMDLFITFANDIEIYGADSRNKTRSTPNILLLNLLGRDP